MTIKCNKMYVLCSSGPSAGRLYSDIRHCTRKTILNGKLSYSLS